MTFRSRLLTAAAAMLAVVGLPTTSIAGELAPHRAEYRIDLGLISGELKTELLATDTGLTATHSVKPRGAIRLFTRGKIREQSTFAAGPDGVVPMRYSSDDSLSSDKIKAEVGFDRAQNRLTGRIIEDGTEAPVDVALEGDVFDRVSIQYQLMSDLLNAREVDQYVLYDIDEFKTLNISRIGTREVDVRAGTYQAVGIQHQAENSSRVTTLWCVEELGYLPVLIQQHRKGELKVSAELTKYEAG